MFGAEQEGDPFSAARDKARHFPAVKMAKKAKKIGIFFYQLQPKTYTPL